MKKPTENQVTNTGAGILAAAYAGLELMSTQDFENITARIAELDPWQVIVLVALAFLFWRQGK